MTARGLAAFGAVVSACIGGIVLSSDTKDFVAVIVLNLLLAAVSALGLLLILRRPRNSVGWILLLTPLPAAASTIAAAIVMTGAPEATGTRIAGFFSLWLAVPSIAGAISLLLRFPTGRPLSRLWARAEVAAFVFVGMGTLGVMFRPGPVDHSPAVVSPFGIPSLAGALEMIAGIGETGAGLLTFAALTSIVLRWRRASGTERQQIKWVVFAITVLPLFWILGAVAGEIDTSEQDYLSFVFNIAGVFFIPASIAIAVLKYRLYDIDVVINRTMVYASLTAVLVGAYAGGVLVFRTLLDPLTADNDIAIAASTLAVAALFGPARRRIQAFIDRRFYRSRYDAQKTLEAFAARLRNEVDIDALSGELVEVVSHTVHPRHASVWLVQEGAR